MGNVKGACDLFLSKCKLCFRKSECWLYREKHAGVLNCLGAFKNQRDRMKKIHDDFWLNDGLFDRFKKVLVMFVFLVGVLGSGVAFAVDSYSIITIPCGSAYGGREIMGRVRVLVGANGSEIFYINSNMENKVVKVSGFVTLHEQEVWLRGISASNGDFLVNMTVSPGVNFDTDEGGGVVENCMNVNEGYFPVIMGLAGLFCAGLVMGGIILAFLG